MTTEKYVFILGAGASVDSGLKTYRGENGVYTNSENPDSASLAGFSYENPENTLCPEVLYGDPKGPEKIWSFLKPLYSQIRQNTPGPFYALLKHIFEKFPESFIITQNVDSYAKTVTKNLVEIHGSNEQMKCMKCGLIQQTDLDKPKCMCGFPCRPNIVLFGENLDRDKLEIIYRNIKHNVKNVIVIGTSLQFPYLREIIKKCRGAKVVHINPDTEYWKNVRKNEIWLKLSAYEGLNAFFKEKLL